MSVIKTNSLFFINQQINNFQVLCEMASKSAFRRKMGSSYVFQFLCGILLLLCMSTCQDSATAASTLQGNETDLHTLLDFKSRIVHDPFHIMSLWNDFIHHCNWLWIIYNNSNGRVMYLILSDKTWHYLALFLHLYSISEIVVSRSWTSTILATYKHKL